MTATPLIVAAIAAIVQNKIQASVRRRRPGGASPRRRGGGAWWRGRGEPSHGGAWRGRGWHDMAVRSLLLLTW